MGKPLTETDMKSLTIRWICQLGQALEACVKRPNCSAKVFDDLKQCVDQLEKLAVNYRTGIDVTVRKELMLADVKFVGKLIETHRLAIAATRLPVPSVKELADFKEMLYGSAV